MQQATIGIIGGTGLGGALAREGGGRPIELDTPFGAPSTSPIVANWEGVDVAFIQRHGPGHCHNPTSVPYHANIWAMKVLGVRALLASGATGSLREEYKPGELVVCDQVIDKTYRRANTFFDAGVAVHVELAEPFCPRLRRVLIQAADDVQARVHDGGTYVCMEGPQFSTRAESMMHRQWGGDLIGMTCMPEARLAREAELCYALVALPTDYDCWRPPAPRQAPDSLLQEILENLRASTEAAVSLFRAAVRRLASVEHDCACQAALRLAVWSDKAAIDPAARARLEPLIGRYLPDKIG